MLKTLQRVEPIGESAGIGCAEDGCRTVSIPVYKQTTYGRTLRWARETWGHSLGSVARAFGLRPAEVSGLERGSLTLSEEEWTKVLHWCRLNTGTLIDVSEEVLRREEEEYIAAYPARKERIDRLRRIREDTEPEVLALCRVLHGPHFAWPRTDSQYDITAEINQARLALRFFLAQVFESWKEPHLLETQAALRLVRDLLKGPDEQPEKR